MKVVVVEGFEQENVEQMANDSNMLLLTNDKKKSAKSDGGSSERVVKKKLTRKEKLRLTKVVERKNKSSRVRN